MEVAIVGAGKIGSLIACMLAEVGDYSVHLIDMTFTGSDAHHLKQHLPALRTMTLNVKSEKKLIEYIALHAIQVVISALPFHLTMHVARAAQATHAHYFDLTEDTATKKRIAALAVKQKTAFVPQCGLAPGFVNMVTHELLKTFDKPTEAKLRVGALPQRASQGCHYSLTWSTDGLINEYLNLCEAIEGGQRVEQAPLEGLESIVLDGAMYEAFNTSGGLGGLTQLYLGKLQRLSYKTIRYPGHRDKMYFLIHELKLNEDRESLKRLLEKAMPRTYQDLVIVYVSVLGELRGDYCEKSYFKKLYPMTLLGIEWSAIQAATASSLCAVVDLVTESAHQYQGLVLQEPFSFKHILENRFGRYFGA